MPRSGPRRAPGGLPGGAWTWLRDVAETQPPQRRGRRSEPELVLLTIDRAKLAVNSDRNIFFREPVTPFN